MAGSAVAGSQLVCRAQLVYYKIYMGPRASGTGALLQMRTPGRGVDGLGSVVAGSQVGAGRNWCTIKYMY